MSPNQPGPVNESISGDPSSRIRSPTRMIPAQRTTPMNWTSPTTAVSTVVQGVRGDAGRFGELCRGGGGGGEAEV